VLACPECSNDTPAYYCCNIPLISFSAQAKIIFHTLLHEFIITSYGRSAPMPPADDPLKVNCFAIVLGSASTTYINDFDIHRIDRNTFYREISSLPPRFGSLPK